MPAQRKCDPGDLKCWVVEAFGMQGKVFAPHRRRASMMVARSLRETGYARGIGEALREMKVRRAPEYDHEAVACGQEGCR